MWREATWLRLPNLDVGRPEASSYTREPSWIRLKLVLHPGFVELHPICTVHLKEAARLAMSGVVIVEPSCAVLVVQALCSSSCCALLRQLSQLPLACPNYCLRLCMILSGLRLLSANVPRCGGDIEYLPCSHVLPSAPFRRPSSLRSSWLYSWKLS